MSELGKIERLVRSLAKQRCEVALALNPEIEIPEGSDDWKLQNRADARMRRRSEIHDSYKVSTKLATLNEEVVGDYVDVIAELDHRTYRRLEFSFGSYGSLDRIEVEFKPMRPGWGSDVLGGRVRLSVRSNDPGFAKQAIAQLSDEIDLGRPAWHLIYSLAGFAVFNAVLVYSISYTASSIFNHIAKGHIWWGVGIQATVAAAVIFTALGYGRPLLSALPPVEIYPDGGSARGGRSIAALISVVVVPILITLLLPLF